MSHEDTTMRHLLSALVIATILTGCGGKAYVNATNQAVYRHAQLVEKSHDVKLMRSTPDTLGGAEEGMDQLDVQYYVYRLMEVEDSRQLMTHLVDSLLKEINKDPELRPHLTEYPFTSDRLTVKLEFNHFFGDYFEPLYIKTVTLSDDMLTYYTFNKKIKRREPYTKAKQLVADRFQDELDQAETASLEGTSPDSIR